MTGDGEAGFTIVKFWSIETTKLLNQEATKTAWCSKKLKDFGIQVYSLYPYKCNKSFYKNVVMTGHGEAGLQHCQDFIYWSNKVIELRSHPDN